MQSDPHPVPIRPPSLSDEAVVEIHHFLEDLMVLFESHYFVQIHRFHHERSRENQPDLFRSDDEPPF